MASRKKGKRKKNKRHRPPRPGRTQHPLPGGGMMVISPPGEANMSEVLLEFLEPYSEHWSTEEGFRKVLTVGLVAWNAALLSGSKREQFLQDMVQAVPAEVRGDMRSIVEEMIRRKETHFADNKRTIIDYQLTMTPSGPHVAVISTLG
jgi:hypothetical protein